MTGIVVLTLILAVVLIAMLFVHDARRAQMPEDDPAPPASPPVDDRPDKRPAPHSAIDAEALAAHVKQLRRAVNEDLIGRDEAIQSIVRQAEGTIGQEAATELLDRSEGE